jgi:uncharacterized protein YaiI (UPF0178 family)
MPAIYVDADACPVKEEAVKVARRHGASAYIVSDGGVRPIREAGVEMVYVAGGPDAADDWIAARIGPGDVCVTSDIPLAKRCVDAGGRVIKPNGQTLDQTNVGEAKASRDLMTSLREQGAVTGGGAPFSKADRSRFLERLEALLQAVKRGR